MRRTGLTLLILLALAATIAAEPTVPIIYSTDLFHPHADPDDHYDLACLFAIAEFDIRGIVLDLGDRQAKQCGRRAVEQMAHITGRPAPCAIGLGRPLRSRDDRAVDEPQDFQNGVKLILDALRGSREKVVLFTTGSCRDVAVAFNRDPALLKEKVRAVYFNIGRGPNEPQEECNVGYDPASYLRMFESGLPLYWCPCFGRDGYETLYTVDQTAVVGGCRPAVRNFFVYCLTRSTADPIAFLSSDQHPLPTGPRAMWCTAPMFHAAGRKVYQRSPGEYVGISAADAERAGLAGRAIDVFQFAPMQVRLDDHELDHDVQPPKPEPGKISAVYAGRTKDRVGTNRPEPDRRTDCCVRVVSIDPQKAIKNIVLTGPKEGRWEYVETGRWWRLVWDRRAGLLDCYFQFYATGEHQIEVLYEDGGVQTAKFHVPFTTAAGPSVALNPADPNGFVFRSTHPSYKQILASCLKNLLSGM